MIDVSLLLACTAALCALAFALWRRLRGPAGGRGRAAVRLAVATLAAAVIVLPGAWQLSKHPRVQLLGQPVVRVDTERKRVALTLDDGPSREYTDEVLAILRQHQARATFFVTGAELARNPDLGRAIVGNGHELGNHSYSHTRMIGSSLAFIADEIERTDGLIRAAGHTGPIYFRPPFGKKLLALPYYLDRHDRVSVHWDVAPEASLGPAATPDDIVTHVIERTQPGSIILMHVMYPGRDSSRRALPGVITGLRARGYELVPLSELLPSPDDA
ncbi:polysaccharide deacetylase family protein [Haliangium sp.]|uniref:polysaccharide deacetylase family protein n=1 Tax=Haliangium sp. TaxID=2663208 RepID=UPI003D142063